MIEIKKLPNSQIEVISEIEAAEFDKYYKKTLDSFKKEAQFSGFRKGHAPEKMVIERFGGKILDEAAQVTIKENYSKIILLNKIDALGSPEVTITKIALGNPLSFKLVVSVLPEFDLPVYKKIAVEKNKIETNPKDFEAADKEVEDIIMQIRISNLKSQNLKDTDKNPAKEEPPELDDEMVKKLGDFKDVSDFMEKLKKNISEEKKYKDKEKRRAEILNDILKETKIDLPEIIVESELNKMMAEFRESIERMGMKSEDYLKHINKKEEDLRKESREEAIKRSKTQLILNQIALRENIKPDETKVKREMEHLLLHHKDANSERVRVYVETVLSNELVLEFLESLK